MFSSALINAPYLLGLRGRAAGNPAFDWGFKTSPQPHVAQRSLQIQRFVIRAMSNISFQFVCVNVEERVFQALRLSTIWSGTERLKPNTTHGSDFPMLKEPGTGTLSFLISRNRRTPAQRGSLLTLTRVCHSQTLMSITVGFLLRRRSDGKGLLRLV